MENNSTIKKANKIAENKRKEVETLKRLFKEYHSFAIINLSDLPSSQLQLTRQKLKGETVIRVSKKRLIKIALEDSEDGIKQLSSYLDNVIPAIIFSRQNAFKLSNFLRKNKSKVHAKPGQIAPRDITVSAGPTPFTPGPIIGELGSLKIKAVVEGGKIVIKQDTVVVKEGEAISAKLADLLAKLDVRPMELGLNLVAAYDEGIILDKSALDFDDKVYVDQIKQIASDAFKLTVGIGYVTPENVNLLIGKAEREAKAIAKASGIKEEA